MEIIVFIVNKNYKPSLVELSNNIENYITLTTLTSIPARYNIGAAFFSNNLEPFLKKQEINILQKLQKELNGVCLCMCARACFTITQRE